MHFFAISGSLRAASLNAALLRAAARLAPPGITLQLYHDLAAIPPFNPDIEASNPAPVAALRSRVSEADAVIIASPEYAHGIPGALKNALDWLVGSEAFIGKPVALFNASPMSVHADAALREVLGVMSAQLVDSASIVLPIRGARLDENGIHDHPHMAATIRAALLALASWSEPGATPQ